MNCRICGKHILVVVYKNCIPYMGMAGSIEDRCVQCINEEFRRTLVIDFGESFSPRKEREKKDEH